MELDTIIRKILHKKQKYEFIPGKTVVPPSGKLIGFEETKNIILSAFDGWLTTGRFNQEFQEKLANFLKVKNLVTVNSGSSANLLAFLSLTSHLHKERAITPGDEIISVAAGFPTTVNPIFQFGAIPVFVDIKLPTYNINEDFLKRSVNY